MLLYSILHLTGYGLALDDLKNFRQLGSPTAGHPEYGRRAPGIETTTGPLGQGISNAVGLALAERMLAARFNRDGHELIDHHTYTIASDGDMQEGVASEASSLAGHLGLGRLIAFYDDNHIQLAGDDRDGVLRGRRQALRGLRLARPEPGRGPRRSTASSAPSSAAKAADGQAVADHPAHAHRLRARRTSRTPRRRTARRWARTRSG